MRKRAQQHPEEEAEEEKESKHARLYAANFERVLVENHPLSEHFATFLPAGSVFALHRANMACRAMAEKWKQKKILTKRVEKALEDTAGLGGPAFKEALAKSEAVVSGSFVLHVINGGGAGWAPDDVDMFRPNQHDGVHFSALENYLWAKAGKSEVNRDPFAYIEMHAHLKVRGYLTPTHCEVITIFENAPSAADWVEQKFDAHFLCNTYDGQSLTVHHADALITSSSPYRDSITGRHLERMQKYLQRGYTYSNVRVEQRMAEEVPITVYVVDGEDCMATLHKDHVRAALSFPELSAPLDLSEHPFDLDRLDRYTILGNQVPMFKLIDVASLTIGWKRTPKRNAYFAALCKRFGKLFQVVEEVD